MKIPFSPPYIDESVIDEVVDSLKSGWITTGPKCNALEAEIKQLTGAGSVLTINSWTSGAIMVLSWLGASEGDEVIVPAYTYSAAAMAVLHAGAKPVMVDVGEDFKNRRNSPEKTRLDHLNRLHIIRSLDLPRINYVYAYMRYYLFRFAPSFLLKIAYQMR